ncbi:MAG: hypothetical protein JWM16_3094 [Verrucomicrobiales bacterium]|nr:hypothetical protein [Verrucomicrobiales bacterium]
MGFAKHHLIARSESSKAQPGRSALVHFCVHLLFLLAAVTVSTTALAQTPINDLIFTVGTTVRDQSSQDWSYVLVGAVDPALLRGKRFAVYAKAGDPSSAAAFTRRADLFQQVDSAAVNSLLNQSVSLGQNLSSLSQTLDGALRRISGVTNQPLPQKVLTLFRVAATNQQTATMLRLLALNNPGIKLSLGHAFTEVVAVVTTYEVREANPITGVPGDVLGRVTITPGTPVVLPAPGAPFQLVTNQPSDHLTIRLRWGTPDALRRLSLLSYGFNVWRMPRALAESGGFNLTPPTVAQLHSNPNFHLANEAPTTATKDFSAGSGPGAADDPADRTTYFFSDNNHRSRPGAQAFADGEEFYYFVTARDILGRDGFVSPGRLARACRRNPPIAPAYPSIRDEPKITQLGGGLTTNEQRFRLTWTQNTNASQLVTHYWIYRWPNPTMTFTNDSVPLSNRVGVVVHVPGTNQNTFLDDFAGSPKTPGLSNYWYTIRAVSVAACDPLLSPHSPPVSGVLRQREGPPATVGTVVGSCGTAAVLLTNLITETLSNYETGRLSFRFVCDRRDPGIAWVRFDVTNQYYSTQSFGPIYFAAGNDHIEFDYMPRSDVVYLPDVACVVGTAYGSISRPANYHFATNPPDSQRQNLRFYAGQVLLTAVSSTDPLLNAVNLGYGNGTYCVPAINPTPDASGTVTMQFNFPSNPPVLIQVSSNGIVWSDAGISTPDSSGNYAILYPACLFGPLPSIRGCVVNLPNDADCQQHVARSEDTGSVAPIHVHFRLTPRTREYRLYRQVNDGALTLLSQGAARFDPAKPSFELVRTDDAMPVSPARLCYYVQLLDEHGNPSPMALIGCKEVKPPQLPTPVLAEPAGAGTVATPQMSLNWFCPTAGVYRFSILVHRLDDPDATKPIDLTGFKVVKGENIAVGSLFAQANFRELVHFSESRLTVPIGSGFGPGPQFTMTVNVSANVPYRISVRAVDAQGASGPISAAWDFTWHPPVPPDIVQWPFRSLPAVAAFHPAIQASLMSNYTDQAFQNLAFSQDYPVGVRIGIVPNWDGPPFLEYTNRHVQLTGNSASDFPVLDPNRYLFRRNGLGTDVILPAALYRQQVTNVNFPRVSGKVTQVSPLLEKLALRRYNLGYEVVDNLVGHAPRLEVVPTDEGYGYGIYLFDTQPVITGAAYQYYLVRFKPNHEVDQIVPAGTVTIP